MNFTNVPQLLIIIIAGLMIINNVTCQNLVFSPNIVFLTIGSEQEILFNSYPVQSVRSTKSDAMLNQNATISFKNENPEIAKVIPRQILSRAEKKNTVIHIHGKSAGYTIITAFLPNSDENSEAYLHVAVMKYPILQSLSTFIGWIYFSLWTVSFYPQLYENYIRRSVVGLNFDYVALNLIGFFLYSAYNCGLYFIQSLEKEYYDRHPKSFNPVQFNDVFFSLHALIACFICVVQCMIYERKDQSITVITKIIIVAFYNLILFTGICAYVNKMHWLDFLYYCSYVKLTTTMIKYIPQALMNYKRKSTVGWSIGNILLDFGGGLFSLLQMLIEGYNYNNYENIIGDPTKFGLGLFAIMFDLIFIYQHYVLYRKSEPKSTPVMARRPFFGKK